MSYSLLSRPGCHLLARVCRDKVRSCRKLSPRSDDAWTSLSTMTRTPALTMVGSPQGGEGQAAPRLPHQLSVGLLQRAGRVAGRTLGVSAGLHTPQGGRGGGKARPRYLPLLHHHGWGAGHGEEAGAYFPPRPHWNVTSMQVGLSPSPGFPTLIFQHLGLCLAQVRCPVNMSRVGNCMGERANLRTGRHNRRKSLGKIPGEGK